MTKPIKSLCVALPLLALLTAGCSGTPESANSNAAAPSSPVAQSGTAPASSEATPSATPVQNPQAGGEAATPPQVSSGAPAQPTTSGPAPKLVIDSMKINFGNQPSGKTIVRTITLKNGGKAPLKIDAVEPSCGCTTVDFPKLIAPGKSGGVKVKVDTGTSPGEHTKSLTIKSNDPAQPSAKVEFLFTTKAK
jgi:hypothetical protein